MGYCDSEIWEQCDVTAPTLNARVPGVWPSMREESAVRAFSRSQMRIKYPEKRELATKWLHNVETCHTVDTFSFGKHKMVCKDYFEFLVFSNGATKTGQSMRILWKKMHNHIQPFFNIKLKKWNNTCFAKNQEPT